MSDLPSAPTFDPNLSGSTGDESATGVTAAAPVAAEEVNLDFAEDVAAAPAAAAPEAPAVAPVAAAPAPAVTAPVVESASIINETVDEVLNQASEQTVRLVELRESVSGLSMAVEDLREEMLAGFVETGANLRQAGEAKASPSEASLFSRLDDLDVQTTRISQAQTTITLLVILQFILLLAVAGMVWLFRADDKASVPVRPAAAVQSTTAPAAASPSGPATPSKRSKANKRQRRRR